MDWWDDYSDNPSHDNNRKRGKIDNDPSKHYPGKPEAKLLRKLKQETGMTEEQLRSHKKYRIMLSNTQKEKKAKLGDTTKAYKYLIKKACRQTKLVPQHPETLKVLQEMLDEMRFQPRWIHHLTGQMPTAQQIVKHYAKK